MVGVFMSALTKMNSKLDIPFPTPIPDIVKDYRLKIAAGPLRTGDYLSDHLATRRNPQAARKPPHSELSLLEGALQNGVGCL